MAIRWSFLIPTHYSGEECIKTALTLHQALQGGGGFEILIIPNGEEATDPRSLAAALHHYREPLPAEIFILPQPPAVGKGSALQAGVRAASGQWIGTTDADLPYRLDAIQNAARLLESGYDWVTLNRRTAESTFTLPLDLLPLAFGRHRLGLLFNWVVRFLFPIPTRDTQAGLKFFDGSFARAAFERVSSPTFFYDVELFLFSERGGFDRAELPAQLLLRNEKSTIRLMRDAFQALYWLGRIWIQDRKGRYSSANNKPRLHIGMGDIAQIYWHVSRSWKERLFLALRWSLTPYRQIIQSIPPRARVWDLGCGHGLLELLLASHKREVLALDHDSARIEAARRVWRTATQLKELQSRVEFRLGHLPRLPDGECDAALAIDVLHYFTFEEQAQIIAAAWDRVSPGGQLIVREVEPQGKGLPSRFNRAYERWSTRRGLTRSNRKTQLYFRTQPQWTEFLASFGFSVQSRTCSHPLFADILYVCRKPDSPV